MVGPEGRAVGVEHIPELVSSSIQNIKKCAAAPLLKEGSLSMHVGGMYQNKCSFLFFCFSSVFRNTYIYTLLDKLIIGRKCCLANLWVVRRGRWLLSYVFDIIGFVP